MRSENTQQKDFMSILELAKKCGLYATDNAYKLYKKELEAFAKAAQADQAEYIGLLELNNKFKEAEIKALKADNEIYVSATSDFVNENAKLRKALEACKYDCHTGEVIGIAKEALGETK